MHFEEVYLTISKAIYRKNQQHLSDIQRYVLEASFNDISYFDMANAYNYAQSYITKDVGPKLWKILSEALEEKISKKNCRTVLEDYCRKQKQELKDAITPLDSASKLHQKNCQKMVVSITGVIEKNDSNQAELDQILKSLQKHAQVLQISFTVIEN